MNIQRFTNFMVLTLFATAMIIGLASVAKAETFLENLEDGNPGLSECPVTPDYWNPQVGCWQRADGTYTNRAFGAQLDLLTKAGMSVGEAGRFVRSIARNGYDLTNTIGAGDYFTAGVFRYADPVTIDGFTGPSLVKAAGTLGFDLTCPALQKPRYVGGDPRLTSSYRSVRVSYCARFDNYLVQVLPFSR